MFVRPAAAHYESSIQKTETAECVRSKCVTAAHGKQSTTVTVPYVRREIIPHGLYFSVRLKHYEVPHSSLVTFLPIVTDNPRTGPGHPLAEGIF